MASPTKEAQQTAEVSSSLVAAPLVTGMAAVSACSVGQRSAEQEVPSPCAAEEQQATDLLLGPL